MKKALIFLTSGEAPDFGGFVRGEIKDLDPKEVAVHAERGTLKEVGKLTKDECRRFFFEINMDDLPDNIKVADMQELLVLTKEAIKEKLDLPEKLTLDKVRKLLKGGGEEAPDNNEEVTEDVG